MLENLEWYEDPNTESFAPKYIYFHRWEEIPINLRTKRQLKKMKLQPVDEFEPDAYFSGRLLGNRNNVVLVDFPLFLLGSAIPLHIPKFGHVSSN